jgi:hypothetical protein
MLADANERIKLYQTGFVDKTLTIARTDIESSAIREGRLATEQKRNPPFSGFFMPVLPKISIMMGRKTLPNYQNWALRMPHDSTSIRT